jgi:two-component system NarL family response regulator
MKVLLADDHPLFLDGIKNLILSRGQEVVGTARDGWEAVEKARALQPEVVLMDVQMPRLDGLAATRLIKSEMPQIKVVMLTMDGSNDALFEAIKGGAAGYLLKTEDTGVFFESLLAMAEGQAPLSAGLAARILKEFGERRAEAPGETLGEALGETLDETQAEALSARQFQVLTLVAEGQTYKEVGSTLQISERTVKYHMAEIVERLQLENRAQAVEYVRRMLLR